VSGKENIADSSPDVDMRLQELKDKNASGTFTDADALEAHSLLEDRGVLGESSFGKSATTQTTLLEEAKKYKTADEFKDSLLQHGTNADIVNGKLTLKGKNGSWDSGGIFLTDEKQFADVFGKNNFKAFVGGLDILDLTDESGIAQVRKLIGTKYKSFDDEMLDFSQQDFDSIFPSGKADFATIGQYGDFFESLKKDGLKFKEFGGGVEANTFQLYKEEIPIFTDKELTDIWKQANQ
jgi:hypothetical protein